MPPNHVLKSPLWSRPHQYLIATIFAVVILAYLVIALYYPIAFIWLTYEDLIGEWSQTYFFLAAMILSLRNVFSKSNYRWFFAILAVACAYVVLEEISWGQRIFGFSTPEFLKARNLQGEANIHNLFTGPYKTFLKDALSYALAAGLVAYGMLYPLACSFKWRPAAWLQKLGVAAPPLVVAPYFVCAAYLELKPFSFNEAEIAEILVAMALAITALHYRFLTVRELQAIGDSSWSAGQSKRFSLWVAGLFVSVFSVAGLTTAAVYSSPERRSVIDNRIDNGIEKFAGRYRRYDRCDISNRLYGRLLEDDPDDVSLIRKMAGCYQSLGEQHSFQEFVDRALSIDLAKLEEDPMRASVNRSVVRTYRLAGEEALADKYLLYAFEIGLKRIADHPDSVNALYSLGRTYSLANQPEKALELLSRAYEMKPASSRYRKAYYRAKRKVDEQG
ncbi:MAG: tetratricopeptide repeat protein [Proteobacteria bacterium]|nr:tetratricopeptide repeat protein [Pseudomonadota bacterium]